MPTVLVLLGLVGLWLISIVGRAMMETNCARCTQEVDDDDVGKCDECERDGLCPECLPHHIHEDDEGGEDE